MIESSLKSKRDEGWWREGEKRSMSPSGGGGWVVEEEEKKKLKKMKKKTVKVSERDEMRWEGGREGESVYYIWWARPPYMDFFPIINAGHFAYKFLITPLWTSYENFIEPRKPVIYLIIIFFKYSMEKMEVMSFWPFLMFLNIHNSFDFS